MVGENCKIINKGKTVFKNIVTGECKILFVDSEEVKSGEWVGVQNGVKNPAISKRLKNMVSAVDKDGKMVQISKEEFDSNRDKYNGVNAGRKGLFDHINKAAQNKKWYERLMFSNPNNTKIKENNSNLFFNENIFIIYDVIHKEMERIKKKNCKRFKWDNINKDLTENNVFIKPIDKPFGNVLYHIKNENWNPYEDDNFIKLLKRYNVILWENHHENQ